jgi:DNA-binding transcriptional ArsR family regulator
MDINNCIHINLSSLAQEAGLEDKYELTYRPDGKKVKELVFGIITEAKEGNYLVFDFSEIEVCDVSCADEIVFESVYRIITEKLHLCIILCNYNEQILENIQGAQLYKQQKLSKEYGQKIGLPVLCYNSEIFLLGDIEDNLQETFDFVMKRKQLTARELSEIKDIAINNASNRLKKLYDYGLIMREVRTSDTGQYYIYTNVKYSPV